MKEPTTTIHPNTRGTEKRTRLSGGPYVDTTTTLAQFAAWKRTGVSQGAIIDRLVAFAVAQNFDPVRNLHVQKQSDATPIARK